MFITTNKLPYYNENIILQRFCVKSLCVNMQLLILRKGIII